LADGDAFPPGVVCVPLRFTNPCNDVSLARETKIVEAPLLANAALLEDIERELAAK